MKIATFNLYNFCKNGHFYYSHSSKNEYENDTEWTSKKEWISTQITRLEPDVIGFEEVFSDAELSDLVGKLGYALHWVEAPGTETSDPLVYNHPIVAIAIKESPELKYVSTTPIPFSDEVADELFIPSSATTRREFSRKPIDCIVRIEKEGSKSIDIHVFVAHLKSKRPEYEQVVFDPKKPVSEQIFQEVNAKTLGLATSLMIRTAEAASISKYAKSCIQQKPECPIIILGDLNTELGSVDYDILIGEAGQLKLPSTITASEKALLSNSLKYWFSFHDAYVQFKQELVHDNQANRDYMPGQRPYTFIYDHEEGVLDHIFGSQHLHYNSGLPNELKVTDYRVINDHLHSHNALKTKTDHGIVMVEIEPRN